MIIDPLLLLLLGRFVSKGSCWSWLQKVVATMDNEKPRLVYFLFTTTPRLFVQLLGLLLICSFFFFVLPVALGDFCFNDGRFGLKEWVGLVFLLTPFLFFVPVVVSFLDVSLSLSTTNAHTQIQWVGQCGWWNESSTNEIIDSDIAR